MIFRSQCPICSSARKVGRLTNPLGTPITSPLLFGSHLLTLAEDGRNLLVWNISEESEDADSWHGNSAECLCSTA
jgi:hypothetical protein